MEHTRGRSDLDLSPSAKKKIFSMFWKLGIHEKETDGKRENVMPQAMAVRDMKVYKEKAPVKIKG